MKLIEIGVYYSMSARAIWEATGKDLINRNLKRCDSVVQCRCAVFDDKTSWDELVQKQPWLQTEVNFFYSFKSLIRSFFNLILNFQCLSIDDRSK